MAPADHDPPGPGASAFGAFDAVSRAMAALPDLAAMEQLANAFFTALPGHAPVTSPPTHPTPKPQALPAGALPATGAPAAAAPADADLVALFASIASEALTAPASPPAFSPSPALPGGPLYVLDEAPAALPSVPAAPRGAPVTSAAPGVAFTELRPGAVPDVQLRPGPFDAHAVRRDFPILSERVQGRPLIWLDSAATTQKPRAVIERLAYFYEHENSNVHRAAHALAARATDAYESAREKVRGFLNAPSTREIVFTRGATEAINLVAQSWGRRFVERGDEIVITWLEHHSNIVPWQLLCAEKGARLRVAPVDDRGQILLDEYEKLLGPRTRIVAFTQVSNALGTVTPAREMVEMAHRYGARVLVDGAQAVSHLRVDVQALGCDFYVFSGHKVFGPTGIGVLRGKADVLDGMPPWQGGGNMIADVTFEKTAYHPAPARFEAGTGNIADAVGLGAAIDYLEGIGIDNVTRYEHELLLYATDALRAVPGLRLVGTAPEKAAVISLALDGCRAEDVGAALDREGIAVRAGHHCAQPALRRFGLESTVRPSLALYNTPEDVDALVAAVRRIQGRRTGYSFGPSL
jgi:cysteine desulfurase/selenocysteine lyase